MLSHEMKQNRFFMITYQIKYSKYCITTSNVIS